MSEISLKTTRYYTAGQVTLAAFLGSVPAACWLIAQTYRAAGDKRKERAAVLWGAGGTLALLGLVLLLPDNFPSSALAIGITFGLHQIAKQLQGALVVDLESKDGTKGSWWMAAGIGIVGLVVILGLITAFVFIMPAE
jgi:hypothetical protein